MYEKIIEHLINDLFRDNINRLLKVYGKQTRGHSKYVELNKKKYH